MDDAVDGGAADAVFHGEVGQGYLAGGVAAPDGALRVNQYGTYTFPIEKVLARQGFRPLRAPDGMIQVLD